MCAVLSYIHRFGHRPLVKYMNKIKTVPHSILSSITAVNFDNISELSFLRNEMEIMNTYTCKLILMIKVLKFL